MSDSINIKMAKASVAFWDYIKVRLYWIIGGTFFVVLSYILYNNMNKPVAGTLVFIGGFIALYFYYVKWFIVDSARRDWPPFQSTCPDFLTLVPPGSGYAGKSDEFKCVDFVGVSMNGRLKKASPDQLESQLKNPDYFFPVDIDSYAGKAGVKRLKQQLSDYGLSWEAMLKGGSISIPSPVSGDFNEYDEDFISDNIDM